MSQEEFPAFEEPSDATINRLVLALDRAYHRPGLLLWRSFLQGVMTGVGATVGTAIVLSVAAFTFSAIGGLSLLRPALNQLSDYILPSSSTLTNPASKNR